MHYQGIPASFPARDVGAAVGPRPQIEVIAD